MKKRERVTLKGSEGFMKLFNIRFVRKVEKLNTMWPSLDKYEKKDATMTSGRGGGICNNEKDEWNYSDASPKKWNIDIRLRHVCAHLIFHNSFVKKTELDCSYKYIL